MINDLSHFGLADLSYDVDEFSPVIAVEDSQEAQPPTPPTDALSEGV